MIKYRRQEFIIHVMFQKAVVYSCSYYNTQNADNNLEKKYKAHFKNLQLFKAHEELKISCSVGKSTMVQIMILV